MLNIFNNKKVNIWKVFAEEMNATFIPAKHDQCAKTEIVYGDWKIILDNYFLYESNLKNKTYTRVTTRYESIDNFRFEIYNKTFIRTIEKLFGAQDIAIERPDFDKKYIVKSNNKFKIKSLLQNEEIRKRIEAIKEINIETSDRKGVWEKKLPENEFDLCYFALKEIETTKELKELLELFKLLLDYLTQAKSIRPKI